MTWKRKGDLIVFVGEAQPPSNRNAFCMKLIEHTGYWGETGVHFRGDGDADASGTPIAGFRASIDGETLSESTNLGLSRCMKVR